MEPLLIIGGGGHAKVIIDSARLSGEFEPVGVLDDDTSRHGTAVLGVPILGSPNRETLLSLGVRTGIIAVGSNKLREQLAERLQALLNWAVIIHPAATVATSVSIGDGSVIFAGGVVQPDAQIGMHVIVNTAATVDHDCALGDFVHLAPGSHLAGGVSIERGAFLGIASSVIPGKTVGSWVTLGAGAVVVNDIPSGVIAKGVPARWDLSLSESRIDCEHSALTGEQR